MLERIRLWDRWGAAVDAVARGLPSDDACARLLRAYDGVIFHFPLERMAAWARGEDRIEDVVHRPGEFAHSLNESSASIRDLFDTARGRLQMPYVGLCVDMHYNGSHGVGGYHIQPPDPEWYYTPTTDLATVERAVDALLQELQPDMVFWLNEVSYANGWAGTSPQEYANLVRALAPIAQARGVKWQAAGYDDGEELWLLDEPGVLVERHDFVFPRETNPERLYAKVFSRCRDLVGRYGVGRVIQGEGSGVGRFDHRLSSEPPIGDRARAMAAATSFLRADTSSELGRQLTFAWLTACKDAGMAMVGDVHIGGVQPVCDEWGCFGKIHPDGAWTRAAHGVVDFARRIGSLRPEPVDELVDRQLETVRRHRERWRRMMNQAGELGLPRGQYQAVRRSMLSTLQWLRSVRPEDWMEDVDDVVE